MPYQGEFASHTSLQRLAQSDRVKGMLGSFRFAEDEETPLTPLTKINAEDLPESDWQPSRVVAIDGSNLEVPVRNGFPGAEASYITMASVILNVSEMRELDKQRPVDPRKFRTLQEAESIECVLPGCNVVHENETSAHDSLRRALFDVMADARVFDDSESLLDTYEVLLDQKPTDNKQQNCPCDYCPNASFYAPKHGCYVCPCPAQSNHYSTDALRIHERMNPAGGNGAIFSEVRQVLERVWVIHVLRALEARNWLSSLARLAIFLDGPLAVFGQPAWLSGAINKELCRINNEVRKKTGGQDILLLGVEKGGAFVEHLNTLDQQESGFAGRLENRYLALLSDAYIKRNIQFSTSEKPYGQATYFGRKFFYKTRTGALIVGSLPFLEPHHSNLNQTNLTQFPRIADAARLLDDLFCSRYPNAVVPLVAAHAEAAIPLNLGKQVLEKMAREMVKGA